MKLSMKSNILTAIISVFIATTMLLSCEREDFGQEKDIAEFSSKGENVSAINQVIDQYSKVIAIALDDEGFRALVKQKASVQFDGDYDILISDLHKQLLPNSSKSVSELLANIVDSVFRSQFEINGNHFLEMVVAVVPNLQISVPVNCEKWVVSNFVPNVVPLPIDFDDQASDSIATYNKEWKRTNVSLDEDPNIPYIVVSVSERIDRNGHSKHYEYSSNNDDAEAPSSTSPTNLVLKYSNNANELLLEWPDVNDDYGYQIYRSTTGTGIQLIATNDRNENIYTDNDIVANQRYTYTVRSLNSQGQPSGYSSTVSWYGSERVPGQMLKLGALKFDNKQALRSFESWVRGKPELVLHIYSGTSVDSSPEIRCIDWVTPQPSRDEIAGRWWSCDININNWDPELDGQKWTFSWSEEDNMKDYEITIGINGTYKDSSGNYQVGASPSVKFKITPHSDMGSLCVNYWDSKTTEYSLGSGFNFKLNN